MNYNNIFLTRKSKIIIEMLAHVSPGYANGQLFNYGCTGRGELDPQSKNVGDPIDEIDRQINHWKQCRRCAKNHHESTEDKIYSYLFDTRSTQCRKSCLSNNLVPTRFLGLS